MFLRRVNLRAKISDKVETILDNCVLRGLDLWFNYRRASIKKLVRSVFELGTAQNYSVICNLILASCHCVPDRSNVPKGNVQDS